MEFACHLCEKELFFSSSPIESRANLTCCSICGYTFHQACLNAPLKCNRKCPKCQKMIKVENIVNLTFHVGPIKGIANVDRVVRSSLKSKLELLKSRIEYQIETGVELNKMIEHEESDTDYLERKHRSFYESQRKRCSNALHESTFEICALAELCIMDCCESNHNQTSARNLSCLKCGDELFDYGNAIAKKFQCCSKNKLACHTLCGSVYCKQCLLQFSRSEEVCVKCIQPVSYENSINLIFFTTLLDVTSVVPVSLIDKLVLIKKYVPISKDLWIQLGCLYSKAEMELGYGAPDAEDFPNLIAQGGGKKEITKQLNGVNEAVQNLLKAAFLQANEDKEMQVVSEFGEKVNKKLEGSKRKRVP